MATRRQLLAALGTSALLSNAACGAPPKEQSKPALYQRTLGRTGRLVTPLGLGGQAALQWTPRGVDAADIIVRAIELGVNYLDTSNMYDNSQLHYGEAFRRLNLAPGRPGYDAALRETLFVATKTTQRFGNDSRGPSGRTAVEDIRRSLSQIFGDGRGAIPDGAYVDLMQMHNVTRFQDVDDAYRGMEARGGKMPDKIGAFATLLDYRDGTNYTGLNPEQRRWIRHVGVSGHSSPVLMQMLRRDAGNDLDTLLVPLNVADTLYLPHQTNVLPLAVARGMGVIAMKVFADGALLGKAPHWTEGPEEVITRVGDARGRISYHDMIRYTLSLPGLSCAIIGTGHIDRADPTKDQIVNNLAAALDRPMTREERTRMEHQVAAVFGATTNYFQDAARGLVQPTDVRLTKTDGRMMVSWQAGLAGAAPIRSWQIRAAGRTLLTIPFRPQLTTAPLTVFLEHDPGASVEVVASETI